MLSKRYKKKDFNEQELKIKFKSMSEISMKKNEKKITIQRIRRNIINSLIYMLLAWKRSYQKVTCYANDSQNQNAT
ncbi:hypothetical protein QQG55_38810 [Brugia pahangi]